MKMKLHLKGVRASLGYKFAKVEQVKCKSEGMGTSKMRGIIYLSLYALSSYQ